MRELKGGGPRARFFSQNWPLTVEAETEVRKTDATLMTENIKLRERVVLLQRDMNSPCRSRKRSAKHYSKRHERRMKKQRTDDCLSSLSWLQEGITPLALKVKSNQTQQAETILLTEEQSPFETLDDDQADLVSMMLFVKDRFNVSGAAYHEMARLCKGMPRHYKLKQKIIKLNQLWDIYPTPNGTTGVQQSFKKRLGERLRVLIRSTREVIFLQFLYPPCQLSLRFLEIAEPFE